MKLLPPKTPEGWSWERLPDGWIRVPVPNSEWARGISAVMLCLALPAFLWLASGWWTGEERPFAWTLPLMLLGSGWILGQGLVEHEWLLSPTELQIRISAMGRTWYRARYSVGSLRIIELFEEMWGLTLQHEGRTHHLYRSTELTEVLRFSAFLQEKLQWREELGEVLPPTLEVRLRRRCAPINRS